jgi:hypothetical protein
MLMLASDFPNPFVRFAPATFDGVGNRFEIQARRLRCVFPRLDASLSRAVRTCNDLPMDIELELVTCRVADPDRT